jgi:hypothetical protein
VTLLENLRAVAASLRDFDHAPDHIEVDTRAVSALLTDAANAIESTTKERDVAEERASLHAIEGVRLGERYAVANGRAVRAAMERDDAIKERDAARAEVARLLALATGPKINDEVE